MPFSLDAIAAENRRLLARAKFTGLVPATRRAAMTANYAAYAAIAAKTNIPVALIAALNERESSSDMHAYPGNGDPLNRRTTHVPRGRGPFTGPNAWINAALDAYHLDGLDQYPKDHWDMGFTLAVAEHFNGFGYRMHGLYSPYVWGGTDIYTVGRYDVDSHFIASGPNAIDHRPGCALLILTLCGVSDIWGIPGLSTEPAPKPSAAPAEFSGHPVGGVEWVQNALNVLIHAGLAVDGSYGARTRAAVREFQTMHGLAVDGIAGPKTIAAITENIGPALAAAHSLDNTKPSTKTGESS